MTPGPAASPGGALASASESPTDPWGPLAVIPPQDGSETARTEGTLRITDKCVVLETSDDVELLVWPADRTKWNAATGTISFMNVDGSIVTASERSHAVLGGGGSSNAESGTTTEEWLQSITWLAPPDMTCPRESRWFVGDLRS
jgi:hypothetical protein